MLKEVQSICLTLDIVHYRKYSTPITTFNFHLGSSRLNIVKTYKYFGVYLDEYIDLKLAINVSIINKSYKLGGLGHYTYTKMFMSGVAPILDYSSAMRIFLGVHKHALNLAVSGDMGLTTGKASHHIEMIRLWSRLLKMPEPDYRTQFFYWINLS